METLKPNKKRAQNAIIMVWVVLVLEIITIVLDYRYDYLLKTSINNGSYDTAKIINAADIVRQISSSVLFIAYIFSCVIFLLWFYGAYYNLHKKVNHLAYSEGWSIISWFIPVVNLYLPYKIMKEIYLKTKEFFAKNGMSEKTNYSTNYLGWWWALFIIPILVKIFSGIVNATKGGYPVDDASVIEVTLIAEMILRILLIPSALITVKVIKDYSKVEPLLAQITGEANSAGN